MRKDPRSITGHGKHRAAEPPEQARDDVRPRRVHGIHGHAERTRRDRLAINGNGSEHAFDMFVEHVGAGDHRPQGVPSCARSPVRIGGGEEGRILCGIEKDTVGTEKLQSVPLGGIVAGRDRDAAPCLAMLGDQLHRGRGDHTAVDDVDPRALQRGAREIGQDTAMGTSVGSEDDGTAAAPLCESGDVGQHRLGEKRLPDDPANAGNAPNQIAHAWSVVRCLMIAACMLNYEPTVRETNACGGGLALRNRV